MSSKKTSKPVPVAAPKSIPNDMAPGASSDALKGRVGTRTHAIHVVFMSHYPKPIPRAVIIAESVELLGADHPSSAKFAQTLGSHMNTMKTRGFVERRDGGWVLSESAAGIAGVAAPPAPKTKRTRKSK
jgi:hypothetical protein